MPGLPSYTIHAVDGLYGYSDEEGGYPFRSDEDKAKGVIGGDPGVLKKLYENFEVGDASNIMTYGLITGIKTNASLAFLGDLVDNEDRSIRCLLALIKLKEKYKERVILIGGNRDFNTIRMGIECYLTKKDGTLPWVDNDGEFFTIDKFFQSLKTYSYKFRHTSTPTYLENVGAWNEMGPDPANSKRKISVRPINPAITTAFIQEENYSRIKDILSITMGAGNGKYLVTELDALFPGFNILSLTEGVKYKLICVMQMVMGFKWDSLPDFLSEYNGLYIRYLELSHVAAKFTIGADKTGLLSHSGFPFMKAPNGSEYTVTAPLGYKSGTPAGLDNILARIEAEKDELLLMVADARENGLTETNSDLISKFVHLTATTTLPESPELPVYPTAALGVPIVQGTSKKPRDRKQGFLRYQTGGAWYETAPGEVHQLKRVEEDGTLINFDIFGHAPQGFLPTAFRNVKGGTLYVCLDVSKIEDVANKYSFAFIHLTETSCEFFGRIVMTLKENDTVILNDKTLKKTGGKLFDAGEQPGSYARENKIIYYIEEIDLSEPVDFHSERPIPALNLSFANKADYTRSITNTSVVVGGRRVLSKNKRATKRQRKQKSKRAKTRRS